MDSNETGKPPVTTIAVMLQIAGGMMVFVIVFVPAVVLDVAISQLSATHAVGTLVMTVMKAAKVILLVTDCVIGALFLVSHLIKFGRLAWEDIKEACR